MGVREDFGTLHLTQEKVKELKESGVSDETIQSLDGFGLLGRTNAMLTKSATYQEIHVWVSRDRNTYYVIPCIKVGGVIEWDKLELYPIDRIRRKFIERLKEIKEILGDAFNPRVIIHAGWHVESVADLAMGVGAACDEEQVSYKVTKHM